MNSNLIQTLTPGDNAFVLDNDRKILPNIGFGIYYFTQSFYSGFAIPRLLSNKEYNLEPHYYFITGGLIKISDFIRAGWRMGIMSISTLLLIYKFYWPLVINLINY